MKKRKYSIAMLFMTAFMMAAMLSDNKVLAGEAIIVKFTPPQGYDKPEVYLDGARYEATPDGQGSYYVNVETTTARTATMYKYNANNVPVGMYVWELEYENGQYKVTPLKGLEDLISYHGFSVRITQPSGIRVKSGIDVNTRAKLTSTGVDGYQLVEYGHIYMSGTNVDKYPFIKGGTKVGLSNGRAYWVEDGKVNDKVTETAGGRYRFASVLKGLPVEQYKNKIAFRAYVILKKNGEEVVIYGPVVQKSIYDLSVTLTDNKTYSNGGNADKFLKNIIYQANIPTGSKKGMQGLEYLYIEAVRNGLQQIDYSALGVKHVLINIDLAKCVGTASNHNTSFTYLGDGKTYYVAQDAFNDAQYVKKLHEAGVEVTAVLLMSWQDGHGNLTYSKNKSSTPFYAWDVKQPELRAVMSYVMNIIYPDVDHWIVGNEVNVPNAYNYTGTSDLETNAEICAQMVVLAYDVLREGRNGDTRDVYISIDRNWASNGDGAIPGNKFLPEVINRIESKKKGVLWGVAQHAYAPDMWGYDIFNSGLLLHQWNSPYMCATNIEVLTNWIKDNYGAHHRVTLSEQGFHVGSQEGQAAAIAYTYYVGQFNNMIDSVIFRSYADDVNDGELHLGLLNSYFADGINASARCAYGVFKYMDTTRSEEFTNPYLRWAGGASSWASIVPNYDASKLGRFN